MIVQVLDSFLSYDVNPPPTHHPPICLIVGPINLPIIHPIIHPQPINHDHHDPHH